MRRKSTCNIIRAGLGRTLLGFGSGKSPRGTVVLQCFSRNKRDVLILVEQLAGIRDRCSPDLSVPTKASHARSPEHPPRRRLPLSAWGGRLSGVLAFGCLGVLAEVERALYHVFLRFPDLVVKFPAEDWSRDVGGLRHAIFRSIHHLPRRATRYRSPLAGSPALSTVTFAHLTDANPALAMLCQNQMGMVVMGLILVLPIVLTTDGVALPPPASNSVAEPVGRMPDRDQLPRMRFKLLDCHALARLPVFVEPPGPCGAHAPFLQYTQLSTGQNFLQRRPGFGG